MQKRFEIYPTGDPYGNTWDCRECQLDSRFGIFRGDISGAFTSRSKLENYLRRTYPNCIVSRQDG